MPTPDPAPSDDLGLVDALVQLSFAVHELLGQIAARHDLSLTQLRLLGILRDRRPGVLELAAALGLEKSSVSGLIDRAEGRGLVERTTAPHDGRAVRVALTAGGRRLARRITAEAAREITALAAPLPPAEQDQLATLATRLLGRQIAAPPAASAPVVDGARGSHDNRAISVRLRRRHVLEP